MPATPRTSPAAGSEIPSRAVGGDRGGPARNGALPRPLGLREHVLPPEPAEAEAPIPLDGPVAPVGAEEDELAALLERELERVAHDLAGEALLLRVGRGGDVVDLRRATVVEQVAERAHRAARLVRRGDAPQARPRGRLVGPVGDELAADLVVVLRALRGRRERGAALPGADDPGARRRRGP